MRSRRSSSQRVSISLGMLVYCVTSAALWHRHLRLEFRDRPKPFARRAQAWLCTALRERGASGRDPAWCWDALPRMAEWELYAEPGEQLAIVVADVPASRVTRVHFLGWSMFVVNGLRLSDHGEEEIVRSWDRIFDPASLSELDDTVVLAVDGIRPAEIVEVMTVTVPRMVACA